MATPISMFGTSVMHFDLGRSRHLEKAVKIEGFALIPRRQVTGTLFCKQSKLADHITPQLILPAVTAAQNVSISSLSNEKINLEEFPPIQSRLNSLAKGLDKAQSYLQDFKETVDSQAGTNKSFSDYVKSEVSNKYEEVEGTISHLAWQLTKKLFLPGLVFIIAAVIIICAFPKIGRKLCNSICCKNTAPTVKNAVERCESVNVPLAADV